MSKRSRRSTATAARPSRRGVVLREACAALAEIAPPELAQSWDNVGLLAGDLDAPVRRLLLCIDMMPAVVAEATRWRADLVVAYHPPLFKPISRLVAPSERMEAGVLRCLRAGAAVYALHTALDAASQGTNDRLAEVVGLSDVVPLSTGDGSASGASAEEPAIGRLGRLSPSTTLGELAATLERKLGAPCVSLVGPVRQRLRRGIVLVGAAGSLPFQAGLDRGDVVITGELRHHDALRLLRNRACAVALSHWSSERPVLDSVAERLAELLPGVGVRVSRKDAEPFRRP